MNIFNIINNYYFSVQRNKQQTNKKQEIACVLLSMIFEENIVFRKKGNKVNKVLYFKTVQRIRE